MAYSRRWCKWLLVAVLLAGQAPLHAEDLLHVYRLAQAHDPQYQAALARFKGDLLMLDLSRSRYLPNVSLASRLARNDYTSDQLDVSQLDVTGCIDITCIATRVSRLQQEGTHSTYTARQVVLLLTQAIYDASLLDENRKARAFIEKSQHELLEAEKELVMRVAAAYLSAVRAIEKRRWLEGQQAMLEQLGIYAEKRRQLGIGSEKEQLEVRTLRDTQALALLAADAEYRLALQQLQQLAGQPLAGVALLAGDLPVGPVRVQTAEEWMQQARASNHGVQAARALEQVSYFDWKARKDAALPTFNFAASYIDEAYSGGRGFSPESTTMAYGVEMRWPIYQGGGITAAARQSAYRLQESKERLRLLEQQLEAAVLGLVLAIEADTRRYEAARSLADSTAALVRVAKKAYENGSGTLQQWFEAERQAGDAQQQLAQVRHDSIEHRLGLLRLTGELSQQDVEWVNNWLEK